MGLFKRLFGQRASAAPAPTTVEAAQPTLSPATATLKITRLASDGRQAVVGEHYHRREISTFVGKRRLATVGDWDAGLKTTAYLHRDPKNRHDRNAVRVLLPHGDSTVLAGYLPADVAPAWQPLLKRLEAAGRVAECSAALYRDRRDDGYQLVLRLSPPGEAEFANTEPDGAVFLPAERQCAVVGEKEHQDVLTPYGQRLGNIWVTLHPTVVDRGKYAGAPTIEVRVDGATVGQLTAAQGARYAELLTYGPVVAAEARVFEGANYLEVQVMLPKVD